jgi:hypothetical protein
VHVRELVAAWAASPAGRAPARREPRRRWSRAGSAASRGNLALDRGDEFVILRRFRCASARLRRARHRGGITLSEMRDDVSQGLVQALLVFLRPPSYQAACLRQASLAIPPRAIVPPRGGLTAGGSRQPHAGWLASAPWLGGCERGTGPMLAYAPALRRRISQAIPASVFSASAMI